MDHAKLTTGRLLLGLVAASVAGLASYVALDLGVDLLRFAVATFIFGNEWKDPHIFSAAGFLLFFGLPLALLLSVAIGLPVWKLAESRPLRSRRDALKIGAAVGAGIGFLFLLLNFLSGLQTYLDPNSSSDDWTYGYQVTRDGLPTLLGWLFEFLNVLYFALAGAVGGLTARWTAFPR